MSKLALTDSRSLIYGIFTFIFVYPMILSTQRSGSIQGVQLVNILTIAIICAVTWLLKPIYFTYLPFELAKDDDFKVALQVFVNKNYSNIAIDFGKYDVIVYPLIMLGTLILIRIIIF